APRSLPRSPRRLAPRVLSVVVALAFAVFAIGGMIVRGLQAEAPPAASAGGPASPSSGPSLLMGQAAVPDVLNARFAVENPGTIPIAELFNLQVNTIVLDPGHGGRDPGTLGATGMTEKDITLDVALRLRDRLERHAGYRILMTRETDEAVALSDRVTFSN